MKQKKEKIAPLVRGQIITVVDGQQATFLEMKGKYFKVLIGNIIYLLTKAQIRRENDGH